MSLARTPSQTVGPYYAIGLCRRPAHELADRRDPEALVLTGQLLDGAGDPIEDGVVELWDAVGARWARNGTDSEGRFTFAVSKPARAPGGAPHLDIFVFARGLLRHQLTRLYFPDEPEANGADPVLTALDAEARQTLVAAAEDGALRFDVRLQGDPQTVFFAH